MFSLQNKPQQSCAKRKVNTDVFRKKWQNCTVAHNKKFCSESRVQFNSIYLPQKKWVYMCSITSYISYNSMVGDQHHNKANNNVKATKWHGGRDKKGSV